MQVSYWERESFFSNIDVAIIGSGIVGLNAALNLKQKEPKLNIVILERGTLPYGASTRNAGFACFGSASELLDDLQHHSEAEVFSLVERRWKGLLKLRHNIGEENMDYENMGGYEVFADNDESLYAACADKIEYLNKQVSKIIGINDVYALCDNEIANFGLKQTKHLIKNTAEGQINTGKMMKTLMNKVKSLGVEILTNIDVERIESNGNNNNIITNNDIPICASKVIVATNAFSKKLLPELEIVPGRAQVLITHPIENLRIKGAFHYDKGYYYFRNVGNRLLLGGGRNLDFKTEETTEFGLTELVQNKLDELLKEVILPETNYTVDMRWSGFLGLGSSKTNIIEEVRPNVFCAIRCGGMGVAIGSLMGEEVAALSAE